MDIGERCNLHNMKRIFFTIAAFLLSFNLAFAAQGDILYGSSTKSINVALPIGASSTCLLSNGSVPLWSSGCGSGSSTNFFSNSGATTTLTTGSVLRSATYNATSTSGNSEFDGSITAGNPYISYQPPTPTGLSIAQANTAGNCFFNDGDTVTVWVYAYKSSPYGTVYSLSYASSSITDNNHHDTSYDVSASWSPSAGAEGYAVVTGDSDEVLAAPPPPPQAYFDNGTSTSFSSVCDGNFVTPPNFGTFSNSGQPFSVTTNGSTTVSSLYITNGPIQSTSTIGYMYPTPYGGINLNLGHDSSYSIPGEEPSLILYDKQFNTPIFAVGNDLPNSEGGYAGQLNLIGKPTQNGQYLNITGINVNDANNTNGDNRAFVIRVKDPASSTVGVDKGAYTLFENRFDPSAPDRDVNSSNFLVDNQWGNEGLGDLGTRSDGGGIGANGVMSYLPAKINLFGSLSGSYPTLMVFPFGPNIATSSFIISSSGLVTIGITTSTTTPATSTILNVLGTTTTQGLKFLNLPNALLGTDASGNVIATTSSGGTNFFSNSSATTSLTTGSILSALTGTFGFINSTTTATSTYKGPIISTCFATSTAGPCITSGTGSGTNFFSNSSATTTLTTGSVLSAAVLNATSSSGNNFFAGQITASGTIHINGGTDSSALIQAGTSALTTSPQQFYGSDIDSSEGWPYFIGSWESPDIWGIGPATQHTDSVLRLGITGNPGQDWEPDQSAMVVAIASSTIGTNLNIQGVINATGTATSTFHGPIIATCFATSTAGPCITPGSSSGGGSISTSSTAVANYFPFWKNSSQLTGTSTIFESTSTGNISLNGTSTTANAMLTLNGVGDVYGTEPNIELNPFAPNGNNDPIGLFFNGVGATANAHITNIPNTATMSIDSSGHIELNSILYAQYAGFSGGIGIGNGNSSPLAQLDVKRPLYNIYNQQLLVGYGYGPFSGAGGGDTTLYSILSGAGNNNDEVDLSSADMNGTIIGVGQNDTGVSNFFKGFTGFGTTTPYGPFVVASSSGSTTFAIDTRSHIVTGGKQPTVSGGTSSMVTPSNDNSGTINVAGTALTSVTMTFATPWTRTPSCTESDNQLVVASDITSVSTTTISFGFGTGGVTTATIWYQCSQPQP